MAKHGSWAEHDVAWAERGEGFYKAHPEVHASVKFLWNLIPPAERPQNYDFESALQWVLAHPEAKAKWEAENIRVASRRKL